MASRLRSTFEFTDKSVAVPGVFVGMERDEVGALYASIKVGDDLFRCYMRDSFVQLKFSQPAFWFTTFISDPEAKLIELRNDEYYRFRAAIRLALKRTDVFC